MEVAVYTSSMVILFKVLRLPDNLGNLRTEGVPVARGGGSREEVPAFECESSDSSGPGSRLHWLTVDDGARSIEETSLI